MCVSPSLPFQGSCSGARIALYRTIPLNARLSVSKGRIIVPKEVYGVTAHTARKWAGGPPSGFKELFRRARSP